MTTGGGNGLVGRTRATTGDTEAGDTAATDAAPACAGTPAQDDAPPVNPDPAAPEEETGRVPRQGPSRLAETSPEADGADADGAEADEAEQGGAEVVGAEEETPEPEEQEEPEETPEPDETAESGERTASDESTKPGESRESDEATESDGTTASDESTESGEPGAEQPGEESGEEPGEEAPGTGTGTDEVAPGPDEAAAEATAEHIVAPAVPGTAEGDGTGTASGPDADGGDGTPGPAGRSREAAPGVPAAPAYTPLLPERPARTLPRRIRTWAPVGVVLLLLLCAGVQLVRPLPAPTLTPALSPAYTFPGGPLKMPWPGEGQGAVEVEGVGVIGTYGSGEPAPIASVTKVMTAYVILREHPLTGDASGPDITVDAAAEREGRNPDESRVPVRKGEKYTQKQMLQMLLLPSANNIARLLARWDAGSEARFVGKMNAAARELGMTGTTYTDPSGLDATTVSTAVDQVKLAKAAMRSEVLREIVDSSHVTLPGSAGRIDNGNSILPRPGVTGVKTGSSTPAGANLLWSADTVVDGEERRIVGMVMGVRNAESLREKLVLAIETYSRGLIEAAQKGVTSATVVEEGDVVGYVNRPLGGRIPLVATKDVRPVGWPGLTVKLELGSGGRPLPRSAKAGAVVGEVRAGEGAGAVRVPVALREDLVGPGVADKLVRLG
ncbi:D-alanyl-D-alanine carboxypeptidase [Streptomyces sp. NPDC051310]|uniref:D-alanyl-D-alanine carboxypeptidase n=1 Tax=Streptomyces sp. NPDC051310 TaxID=3365649 RepID=UPI0037A97B7B